MKSLYNSLLNRAKPVGRMLASPAMVRPTVLFQSDDWGRVGLPSLDVMEKLKALGVQIGGSAWDYYGLETEEDVVLLADLLESYRDRDGRAPCLTANFVVANADLRAMSAEGFGQFRWISLLQGFPVPWQDRLIDAYRDSIQRGVFQAGLHGFTHFNVPEFMRVLNEDTALGHLARTLARNDVPYLASLTPEFNFALLTRREGESFLDEASQAEWLESGVRLFTEIFGHQPKTTCAPGYRFNSTTLKLWRECGIRATQNLGIGALYESGDLLRIERNVHFEPALSERDGIESALRQAKAAFTRGFPIVVSSHSINYITRHLGRADESRQALSRLLESLLRTFPNLRFATDADLLAARDEAPEEWFRGPSPGELAQRSLAVTKLR